MLSDNDALLATVSLESVKLWNFAEEECAKNLQVSDVVAALFLPTNKHIVLGTRAGALALYDVASTECLQELPVRRVELILQDAHTREVWGLDVHLNPKTKENDILVLSGSADKTLKFWTLTVENVQTSATLNKA